MLPVSKPFLTERKYDIYPSFKINDNQIFTGFETLAEKIQAYGKVTIDGYGGVFFDLFRIRLDNIFRKNGYNVSWINTDDLFKPEEQILEMTASFLGGNDPLFGKKTSLNLVDFFIAGKLKSASPDTVSDINIIIGPGAALAGWEGG